MSVAVARAILWSIADVIDNVIYWYPGRQAADVIIAIVCHRAGVAIRYCMCKMRLTVVNACICHASVDVSSVRPSFISWIAQCYTSCPILSVVVTFLSTGAVG